MNDYGKPRNEKTQQDKQAHDLIEQLNLLEAVDRRITPEHVAKRFRELLDDIGDDGPPSPAADQHPRGILDQPGRGPQLTEYTAEHWADLLGLSGSLEAAVAVARSAAADIITDAQLKAKTVSDELRRTQEAVAAARQQAEQILVDARTEADEALERAVKMIRDAGEQAAQIINHARQEAEQIITAAQDQQVQETAWAGHGGPLEVFRPPARRLTPEAATLRNLLIIDYMISSVTAEVRTDQYLYPTDRADHGKFDLPTAPDGIKFATGHGSRQTVGGLARAGELFGLAASRLLAVDHWQKTVNAYSAGLLGTAATVAPTLPRVTGQFYQAFHRAAVYNRRIDIRRHQSILELAACRGVRLVGIGGVEGTGWMPNLAIDPGLILADVGDESAARHVAELLAQHGDLDRLRTLADAGDEYAAVLLAELADEGQLRFSLLLYLDTIRAVAGIERVTRQLVVLLAVLLNAYAREEKLYGYAIMKMARLSGPSTYRNLDRLEEEGLVVSQWEGFPPGAGRPVRCFYRLTDQGADTARQIVAERRPKLLEHPKRPRW